MILFTGVTNGNMDEGTAFRNMDDSKAAALWKSPSQHLRRHAKAAALKLSVQLAGNFTVQEPLLTDKRPLSLENQSCFLLLLKKLRRSLRILQMSAFSDM